MEKKLVLLPKANKPTDDPSGCRPICLLDMAGKLLERIIANRLQLALGEQSISNQQFGFRICKSTTDAEQMVKELTQNVIKEIR